MLSVFAVIWGHGQWGKLFDDQAYMLSAVEEPGNTAFLL